MAGKSNDNTTKIRCSFCGKTEKQVRKLIAGPGDVFICDECISLCDEILEDELQELYSDRDAEEEVEINLLKPKEIKEFLDDRPMVSLFTRPRRFGKTISGRSVAQA